MTVSMKRAVRVFCSWVAVSAAVANATSYYVSTSGSDANDGTIDRPFATLQYANETVVPGDAVYIRGGTYQIAEKQIGRIEGVFARVICLDTSGEPGRPINYFAYQDERPVFDFSDVKPDGYRVYAISVPASWIHLKGIDVVGVQVTIKEHTQSICVENNGSHNIFEQLRMHDSQAIGFYSTKGSDNLILNCDAYNNWDYTSENGRGGDSDGFGYHPDKGATGNVFRGCRAWFNSDDGLDLIHSMEPVVIENCWAFDNGYSTSFERLGDGNGFKGGGYGSTPVDRLPDPVPRHTIRNCLAVNNRASGFYANHHIGGNDWIGNTAYGNSRNFNMLGRPSDNGADVPGYGHKLHNNLAYGRGPAICNSDSEQCDLAGNIFGDGPNLTDADFQSLDEQQLFRPRQPNGDLPVITFMKPVNGSAAEGHGYRQELPHPAQGENDMQQFQQISEARWQEVFNDPCTGDWTERWMLDGLKASVKNGPTGMELSAGLVQGDDSCHAVLWTKQRFEGDIRIDYEFTKLDDSIHNVIILYVLATGSGAEGFDSDIMKWNNLREIPSMRTYFNHMNTYHISYSAFDQDNADPQGDYIRARRYLPETGQGLEGTALIPDYSRTGLFETGVPYRITVIKKDDDLFMHIRGNGKEKLCHWKTDDFPPITEGRVGLRHMYTRSARYRDFRISRHNQSL